MSSTAKVKQNCDAVKKKTNDCSDAKLDKTAIKEITSVIPKKRQELLKWDGWGYKDSYFSYENGQMVFQGDRYPIGGGVTLPAFKKYCQERLNIDLTKAPNRAKMPTKFPEPNISKEFLAAIKQLKFDYSLEGQDRLVRSHGQTLHDIAAVRQGGFKRIPDIVVWPKSHQDVEELVSLGNKYNVAIIPFGGGTSVSGAATCPQDEPRCMVALDTSQMNRMLWLNKASLTACFESGIIGQDLERELNQLGLTLGHEPDSYEFSSLGGWVATRASGMKKNVYGNIEDLVVSVKMVTCKGTLERKVSAPRISSGPDFNQVILGSEGTLGVVTEVQLKVRPLPQVRRYGSLVFANFSQGVKFMREVAKQRCQPASIRLVDNEQFKVAQAMRPGDSLTHKLTDYLKKVFLQRMLGFDVDELVAVTLLFEGDKKAVTRQQKQIEQIAEMFGGVPTGSKNGKKGYLLTFVIAYVRDIALDYSVVAESFETSTSWDRCESLCRNVKFCIERECSRHGIKYFVVSYRVTQTYDAGCCIYFYFGFNCAGLADPVHTYEAIETQARKEILSSGGSISHHHGVGKIRSQWYPQTVSDVGVQLFKAAKRELDPKNIFAVGNLIPNESSHSFNDKVNKNQLELKAKL